MAHTFLPLGSSLATPALKNIEIVMETFVTKNLVVVGGGYGRPFYDLRWRITNFK